MTQQILVLIAALAIIVVSCELFTNGIEWLGQRLNLSEGAVGSVLAAIGTALPETILPIVAGLFKNKAGSEVGVGAIAGAPFMLSTLTLGLVGISVLLFSATKRRQSSTLNINNVLLSRDLSFFIIAWSLALVAFLFRTIAPVRWLLGTVMFGLYPLYLYKVLTHEGEVGEEPEALLLSRLTKGDSNRLRLILPQVFLGLLGMTAGAFFFVDRIEGIAKSVGIPPLLLSLIICPIATELPEKINSVMWSRVGKDTLALGNITGALVFQSCIPGAFGVIATDWNLSGGTFATGVVAITSTGLFLTLVRLNKLAAWHLLGGAVLYAMTMILLFLLDHGGSIR